MKQVSGILAACLMAAVMVGASAAAADFTLTSAEFADGDYLANEQVFAGFGCEGKNISPSLSWSGAPAETKSFALTVYDPDAPTGSGWWHWVVVNIPPGTSELPKGAGAADGANLPTGALQVRTDYGTPGYGGPCPPQGDHPHRYFFTIHALDLDSLDVTADSSAALVGFYLNFHTLAKSSLMGLYKR
ncbi:MAG: YbhB/YbcL family Raf kinase inhibitor-like protein [Planctomycetes bacterium]|nr:YbhB/YbcL family Raf kinase inhibitor-like protein [Planctomycetota bacterium]